MKEGDGTETVSLMCCYVYMSLHTYVAIYTHHVGEANWLIASYPGRFVGGGKTAWYRLFAQARNIPFIQLIFSSIIL